MLPDVSKIQLNQILFAPFKSAQETQVSLSLTSLKYISDYGLDSSGNMKIVQIKSTYYDASSAATKDISFNIPMISLINIPCLYVKNVSIDFDINIQSQTIGSSEFNPSVIASSNYFNNSIQTQASINTNGYVSGIRSTNKESHYNIHIDAINEKPIGLLMIYDFINKNRDLIRPATGSNITLKSIFG